jgi:hypothetical protein
MTPYFGEAIHSNCREQRLSKSNNGDDIDAHQLGEPTPALWFNKCQSTSQFKRIKQRLPLPC